MEHNDRKSVAALLMAKGIKGCDLAKVISVTPETISRWRREEAFRTLVNELRMEIVEVTRERLRSKTEAAVEVLSELMENSKSEALRIKAASEILRLSNVNDPRYFGFGLRFGETLPESEWHDFGV
jgi:transcriptional regulator with XRE-family HTH domain